MDKMSKLVAQAFLEWAYMGNDYLFELYIANGYGAFTSSQPWLREVTGTLFCPHCHNIYESVQQVDAVVKNKKRQTDVDLIAVNCGGVQPIALVSSIL